MAANASRVVRSAMWLYIGAVVYSLLGYVFWIVVSLFVQPGVVGSAAATMAFVNLLLITFSLGLPMGLRRFVGIGKGKKDFSLLFSYFFGSLLLLVAAYVPMIVWLGLASLSGTNVLNLSSVGLSFAAALLLLGFWPPVFTSLFESLLRAEVSAIATTFASIARLALGVLLLFLGFEFFGIMLAFVVASIVGDLVLLAYSVTFVGQARSRIEIHASNLRDLLVAGIPSWIPRLLTVFAQTSGILLLYAFVGEKETGLYYIAFAISAIVYTVSVSIQNLMFPVLSGMKNGRETAILRATLVSLALAAPSALALAVYPSLVLSFLGGRYLEGSALLATLALGAAIAPISSGYVSYTYALGRYLHVGLIGLATTLSRFAFYFLLVRFCGVLGIAASYSLGEVVGVLAMLPSSRLVGYSPDWRQYGKTLAVPLLISIALLVTGLPWFFGVPALFIVSFVAYTRLGVILKSDLRAISEAFLSKGAIERLYAHGKPIVKLLFGE